MSVAVSAVTPSVRLRGQFRRGHEGIRRTAGRAAEDLDEVGELAQMLADGRARLVERGGRAQEVPVQAHAQLRAAGLGQSRKSAAFFKEVSDLVQVSGNGLGQNLVVGLAHRSGVN